MPQHPHSRMNALVVPALGIDRVGTKHLQLAAFNLWRQHPDHPAIFVLKEPSHRSRKHHQRRAAVSKDQRFHVTMKFLTVSSVIFAVHFWQAARSAGVSYPIL